MKKIYTSVDIGSESIKVVVCELFKNRLNLLAASSVKSKGIKKGVIVSIEDARETLLKAFEEVEVMLGIKIKRVIASIPSYFAEYLYAEAELTIENENQIIGGHEVIKVLQKAVIPKMNQLHELVTVMPIDFKVDDQASTKDPKGLKGNVLSTRAIMVTTPKKNIYSVLSLIESINVEVVDISLNNIGDMFAFKTPSVEQQVGAIINIGSEATSVSLYNKGIVVKSSIIGFGGINIDNDISYIYNIDNNQASQIKENFALAHKIYASANDFTQVETKAGQVIDINQFEVSEIVMARIEEILKLAKKEINILTNQQIQYIIITGGISNMEHFNYIADEVFGKNIVIGDIKLIGVRDNIYSSAIGNIIYFINKLKLRGNNYSMFSEEDMHEISSTKKNLLNLTNDTMLGKVFGYFWNE